MLSLSLYLLADTVGELSAAWTPSEPDTKADRLADRMLTLNIALSIFDFVFKFLHTFQINFKTLLCVESIDWN